MAADSVGRRLPLFGESLFLQAPSTFSPVDNLQVSDDYVIGPGDELQIRIWGQIQADLRVTVDRSGQIYIPQVGEISLAGIRYQDLEERLKREVSRVFKNFSITTTLGKLHAIQVIVVGEARYPGTYTISSLSTLVNAIFSCGGPSPQGSLRHIELRRNGVTLTDFDLYDLLIKGDKSKDLRLSSGDVLFIPHVGPLVAIAGSVNVPAIYEIKDAATLSNLFEIAGGLSNVADTTKITIDRIVNNARAALEFPFDESSRGFLLKDGDIIRVLSIIPQFENTVTLRGSVANPGRYPWKPGMRVRDLIPDPESLLTRAYWRDRAAIVNGRATEYPVRRGQGDGTRSDLGRNESRRTDSARTESGRNRDGASDDPRSSSGRTFEPDPSRDNLALEDGRESNAVSSKEAELAYRTGGKEALSSKSDANRSDRSQLGHSDAESVESGIVEDVRRNSPEINWDYATIQRVNPEDLSSKLIWISPRKAIIDRDEASNLELRSGDIITIFSQRDISVPEANRSRYVTVEGEVMRPGVYKLEANDTLRAILQRAGGLSSDAYLYGTQLTRESARVKEQKSLDELARTLEVQIRQTALSVASSSQTTELPQLLSAQEAIIAQLHNARATGRVALPVRPLDHNIADFPEMVMEDNDRLVIPHTPSTVSVVGNVYSSGSFIYERKNTVSNYLDMAGKGKPQSDLHHAFVLRANGVVVAANNVNGAFVGTRFDRLRLFPGDQIVVPYKLPTGAFVRGLRDWSQIASQLAVTGVVLATVLR